MTTSSRSLDAETFAQLRESVRDYVRNRLVPLEAKIDRESSVMDISCCKLFCAEMVGRIADRAVQIFGGSGYVSDYCVERFYRDVRLFRLYEGTSQIQQLIIAKSLLSDSER